MITRSAMITRALILAIAAGLTACSWLSLPPAACTSDSDCSSWGALCREGTCWTGSGDAGTTDAGVDPCSVKNVCDSNAKCTVENNTAVCTCDRGYTGDGTTCTLDPCVISNGGCATHATCTNNNGKASCVCNQGYTGDGKTCAAQPGNPCSSNNGGCDANATCADSNGASVCTCNSGYTGNGVTCTAVTTACSTKNGGCDVNATCSASGSTVHCACKTGFSGTGKLCLKNCAQASDCSANGVQTTCTAAISDLQQSCVQPATNCSNTTCETDFVCDSVQKACIPNCVTGDADACFYPNTFCCATASGCVVGHCYEPQCPSGTCPAGFTCSSGNCAPNSAATYEACGPNVALCSGATDYCIISPSTNAGVCMTDCGSGCPSGEVCSTGNNVCAKSCTSSAGCPTGTTCQQGECFP